jgi:predicted permease
MDIVWVLINCLVTIIQIYIYLGIGILGYCKGIIDKKASSFLSKLVAFVLFPFYNMLELSRVATPENMKVFWLLMISTLTSIFFGFIISILLHKLFKLDKRTTYSFSLLTCLPAIGSIPLVLGKALCIIGGPLDGDPRCSVINGFMVINLMIFQIQMFFTGYTIILKDIDILLPFEEKLHYIWHLFLYKKGMQDIAALDLFEKYLKNRKFVNTKYKAFIEQNKIIHSKGCEFKFKISEDKEMRSVILGEEFYGSEGLKDLEESHSLDYSVIETIPNNIIYEEHPEHRTSQIIQLEKSKNLKLIESISSKVLVYYGNVFRIIDEDLNMKYKKEYEEVKHKIIHNLRHFPPKFPTVKSFLVDENTINEIDTEFKYFEQTVKALNPEFKLTEYAKKSNIVIYGKVYYPPIIACFLGLLIGLSGMSDIVFSANHYLKNFFDAWPVITVLTVPFIYATAGFVLASTKSISRDMILTKKDILVGMLIRFIIIPGIGLLWIFIWKNYYGGIVEESKVIRFSMFIPFSLPVAATLIVFLNLVNFYIEETGLHISVQYVSSLIFLTVLFLIYFILLGT